MSNTRGSEDDLVLSKADGDRQEQNLAIVQARLEEGASVNSNCVDTSYRKAEHSYWWYYRERK